MKINGYTPRQFAMDAQMQAIRNLYREVETRHTLNDTNLSPGQAREVMRHLALSHNSLLTGSGLDGIELVAPVRETADA